MLPRPASLDAPSARQPCSPLDTPSACKRRCRLVWSRLQPVQEVIPTSLMKHHSTEATTRAVKMCARVLKYMGESSEEVSHEAAIELAQKLLHQVRLSCAPLARKLLHLERRLRLLCGVLSLQCAAASPRQCAERCRCICTSRRVDQLPPAHRC